MSAVIKKDMSSPAVKKPAEAVKKEPVTPQGGQRGGRGNFNGRGGRGNERGGRGGGRGGFNNQQGGPNAQDNQAASGSRGTYFITFN